LQAPKSGRTRRVAIGAELASELGRYYDEQIIVGGVAADGYVWPGRDAHQAMGRGVPGQLLARTLRRARLLDADHRPLVTFHGLRHTAAALAFAHGVPLLTISRQLGHSNPAITAKVYAHLVGDDQLDAFARAMDRTILRSILRDDPDRGRSGSTKR
jgi:integrase